MDFVNFEIAKKLKEKGFPQGPDNWRSYSDWLNHAEYYHFDERRNTLWQTNNCIEKMWYDPNISRDELYFAPTISQVLKWLREEKNIYVGIAYIPKCPNETGVLNDFYYPTFQKIGLFEPMFFGNAENYDTYNYAALA